MKDFPEKSVFFHYRFKFLAITSVAFFLYIILTGANELDKFASSPQFKLVGPYLVLAGCVFLIFRKVPLKCPHCQKLSATKKDWTCCECGKKQGKSRYLSEKCVHCGQMQSVSTCDHCRGAFRL